MTETTTLSERSAAYARMAETLAFLGEHWRDWPDLASCARQAGLSPAHFQREFTHWAGLSPKQYLAALAHAETGAALREGASVMDAAYEAGLSSVSRLHDLFIAHEGLSPGEAKRGGKGTDLVIGRAPTPFGPGVWLISSRGLVALGFIDDNAICRTGFEHKGLSEENAFSDLASRYPDASIRRDDREAEKWAEKVFVSGEPLPAALYGTPFRRQVWRALLDIPVGTTETYGAIARSVGKPGAARATGTAIGANPLSWFIPCHRAIAADKRLHNYHWGLARKRAMLTFEALHAA